MGCVVNIESNEADGQDSSVHSFFYYLLNFNKELL